MSDLLDRDVVVTPAEVRRTVPPPRDQRSTAQRVFAGMFTIAIVVAAVYFWPARLGGLTRLVIVSGDSMEPTYDLGDLVVARDGDEPDVGDTVVFEVPTGPAEGLLVIHRVLTIDADGTITTQGDNRDTPDQWALVDDDVVGEPIAHVPKAGLLVWMVRSPFVLACLVVLIASLLMWPRGVLDDDDEDVDDDEADVSEPVRRLAALESQLAVGLEMWRLEPPPLVTSAASLLVADRDDLRGRRSVIGRAEPAERLDVRQHFDFGAPIDPSVMAEAEAWVDEQLALARSR